MGPLIWALVKAVWRPQWFSQLNWYFFRWKIFRISQQWLRCPHLGNSQWITAFEIRRSTKSYFDCLFKKCNSFSLRQHRRARQNMEVKFRCFAENSVWPHWYRMHDNLFKWWQSISNWKQRRYSKILGAWRGGPSRWLKARWKLKYPF